MWPAGDNAALPVCVRDQQLGPALNSERTKSRHQPLFHHSNSGAKAGWREERERRGRGSKVKGLREGDDWILKIDKRQ